MEEADNRQSTVNKSAADFRGWTRIGEGVEKREGRGRIMVCAGKASELPNQTRGGFAGTIYHKVTICQELLLSD